MEDVNLVLRRFHVCKILTEGVKQFQEIWTETSSDGATPTTQARQASAAFVDYVVEETLGQQPYLMNNGKTTLPCDHRQYTQRIGFRF